MIAGLAARLAGSPRGRAALLGAAVVSAALLALSPGPLAPAAARAALAAAALALLAAVSRRPSRGAAPPPLAVLARASLGGGAGVAVVDASGRRLLVGFGRDGVSLVAELDRSREVAP